MPTRLTGRALLQSEGIFELKKTPGVGLCIVARCKKSGKMIKGVPHFLCHRHAQQRWRTLNRKESAYATLRDHAVARKIPFTISLQYWEGLTDAYCFWDHSAESRGEVLTIDRVHADRPYEPGNLRIITLSENSGKSNKERWLAPHIQAILDRKRELAKEKIQKLEETYEERLERLGDPF